MRTTRTSRGMSRPQGTGTDDDQTSRRLGEPRAADRPQTGKKHGPSGSHAPPSTRRTLGLPVEWRENGPPRPGFAAEYVSIGSLPGVLHHLANAYRLRKVLCQTLVLSQSSRPLEGTPDARFTSALLIKILRRGRTPLPTLGIERAALETSGLTGNVAELSENTHEVGWNSDDPTDALTTKAETILAQAISIVGDVKKLITATLEGVEGLADAVRGLKTATNTIQQSDPGRIAATLKNIETQIEALAREVSAISETKAEVAELKETITRTASVNEERTRAMMSLLKCVWVAAAPVLCLHSRGTASRSTRQASGSHRRDARSPAACC